MQKRGGFPLSRERTAEKQIRKLGRGYTVTQVSERSGQQGSHALLWAEPASQASRGRGSKEAGLPGSLCCCSCRCCCHSAWWAAGVFISSGAMAGTGLGSVALDLEKLRMAGAGLALAVLTSGGDAQGQSGERETFCILSFTSRFLLSPPLCERGSSRPRVPGEGVTCY